jgi:hypothetical protein
MVKPAVIVLLFAALASAQTGTGVEPASGTEWSPCQPDVQKFCAAASNESERFHCLDSNKEALSPECRQALGGMREAGHQFRQDCQGDIAKLCASSEGHALMICLGAHRADLSPACGQRIDGIKQSRHSESERIAAGCKNDAQTFCGSILPGDHRIRRCLKQHEASLKKDCLTSLSLPDDSR